MTVNFDKECEKSVLWALVSCILLSRYAAPDSDVLFSQNHLCVKVSDIPSLLSGMLRRDFLCY